MRASEERTAGGVGIAAVEIAKAMGARVIAAASTEEKLEFAASAGADETINYSETPLKETVKEMTSGNGADVVYDHRGSGRVREFCDSRNIDDLPPWIRR